VAPFALVFAACGATASVAPRSGAPGAGSLGLGQSFDLGTVAVFEPGRPAVYLAAPGGSVQAVDPRSGETLWTSGEADMPLLVVEDRLLTRAEPGAAGVLPLVLLDAADGGQIAPTVAVTLPAEVRARVDESLGTSFHVRAWEDESDAVVSWEAIEREVTGMAPATGAPPIRRWHGAARVDFYGGFATELPPDTRRAAPPLPPSLHRLLEEGELQPPIWRSGPVVATTVEDPGSDGRRRLLLRRWRSDTGAPLPDVALEARDPRARLPSADRRHLVVTSPIPAVAGSGDRYLWLVHSLVTGERVAEVPMETSAGPFCVSGRVLLHVRPRYGHATGGRWVEEGPRLRAVGLDTGAEIWSHPLRETDYRGQRPPGPPPAPGPPRDSPE
jgi:hypothetical protein